MAKTISKEKRLAMTDNPCNRPQVTEGPLRSGAGYTCRDYTVTVPMAEYLAGFRDVPRFLELCRQCPNYGCSWACPPFAGESIPDLDRYRSIMIVATRIVPDGGRRRGIDDAEGMMRPERLRVERWLLQLEKEHHGRAFGFSGTCPYCPPGTCARRDGHPCRHPELVRPSLEACGFNLGDTLTRLFAMDLQWSADGNLPPALTLIAAVAW